MTTKRASARRCPSVEDLGFVAPELADRGGYAIEYLDVWLGHLSEQVVLDADLVVHDSPVGANDGDRYPFVDDEIDILRTRIRRQAHPGHLLGRTTTRGADVTATRLNAMGYSPLTLTDAGLASRCGT